MIINLTYTPQYYQSPESLERISADTVMRLAHENQPSPTYQGHVLSKVSL